MYIRSYFSQVIIISIYAFHVSLHFASHRQTRPLTLITYSQTEQRHCNNNSITHRCQMTWLGDEDRTLCHSENEKKSIDLAARIYTVIAVLI